MLLYEYQGKEILKNEGVNLPYGQLTSNANEAIEVIKKMGLPAVFKVQVPTGGRGKAGGVVFIEPSSSEKEIRETYERLMNTDYYGYKPIGIYVEKKVNIAKELYLSFILDDLTGKVMMLFSTAGGVEIEQIWGAKNSIIYIENENDIDESILKTGEPVVDNKLLDMVKSLFRIMIKYELLLLEINPLGLTVDRNLVALDVKINTDDDAYFRYPNALKKIYSSVEREDIAFVELNVNGNVAVISGGAGLCMATIDILKSNGLEPANFLDLGGGATPDKVFKAIKTVSELKSPQIIFINVYGGINNLVDIANGVIESKKKLNLNKKIFIKMMGHGQVEAAEILKNNGIEFIITPNTKEAALRIKKILGD